VDYQDLVMGVGRPTIYSEELIDTICERLATGESLRSVCRDDEMPAMASVFKWLRENRSFSEQYAKAKEESADALVEDMLDIADNQAGQEVEIDGKLVSVKDGPSVAHARLRVDTRKWAASKLKPKKYGDKITQEHQGSVSLVDMSDDQLNAKLQALINADSKPD
jgi:hypothetical protein